VVALGPSGLEIESPDQLKTGQRISLSIHLPQTRNFIIADADVTGARPHGTRRRFTCTFRDVPVPLLQRIRKVMRDFEGPPDQAGAVPAEEVTRKEKAIKDKLHKLVINQDVFIDVLELYAMGVNLNDYTRAAEFTQAQPEEPTAPRKIPIYAVDESGALAIDSDGAPAGEPVAHIFLPVGEGDESFACRCSRRIDAFPGVSFERGSILIFSYERQAEDCDIILCPSGTKAVLGRIYDFHSGALLVFRPSGHSGTPVVLDRTPENCGYRLIARYERM
jgi:hypothetical protein